jgi:hypothetical protein
MTLRLSDPSGLDPGYQAPGGDQVPAKAVLRAAALGAPEPMALLTVRSQASTRC